MGIDKCLKDLFASVSTALDEYRRQASIFEEDDYEFSSDVRSSESEHSDTIRKSIDVGKQISVSIIQIKAESKPSASNPENLRRTLSDANGLNGVARSELRQQHVSTKWLKSIARRMREYPNIIRNVGRTIQISHDIIDPLSKRWNQLWSEISNIILENYLNLGNDFISIAEKLERRRKSEKIVVGSNFSSEPNIEESFDHWAYELIRRRQVGNEGLSAHVFYSEIRQATGQSSTEFARRMGYTTVKHLIDSSPILICEDEPSSYTVKLPDTSSLSAGISEFGADLSRQIKLRVLRTDLFQDSGGLTINQLENDFSNNKDWITISKFQNISFEQYVRSIPGIEIEVERDKTIVSIHPSNLYRWD